MSKYFECKGCKEKFKVDMESSNKGYCFICNEFFMKQQLAELKAENEKLKFKIEEAVLTSIDGQKYDELKAENERLKESEQYFIVNYDKIVDDLKQQLKEKDKEIEKLKVELSMEKVEKDSAIKFAKSRDEYSLKLIDKLKTNTKQTYNNIKTEIVDMTSFTEDELKNMIYDLDAKTVLEILDKLEKGENV